MADQFQPKESFPDTDLILEDLQIILDNIDDHLSFWQVLYNDAILSQDDGMPAALAQTGLVSDWLKMSSAPLYTSEGIGGARGLAYRFLNLAIKIFGFPQIQFNRKLREFLGELLLTLNAFNIQAASQKSTVEKLNDRIRALEAENSDNQRKIETFSYAIKKLQTEMDRMKNERSGENEP